MTRATPKPAKQAQWFINGQKDEGLRPKNIQAGGDLFLATMLKIYEAYEAACAREVSAMVSTMSPGCIGL